MRKKYKVTLILIVVDIGILFTACNAKLFYCFQNIAIIFFNCFYYFSFKFCCVKLLFFAHGKFLMRIFSLPSLSLRFFSTHQDILSE